MPSAGISRHSFSRPVAALLIFLATAATATAQSPIISSLTPLAVKPGTANDVKVRGSQLAGTTALWTSFPADTVLTPDVPNNGMANEEVTFRVTVPVDAPVGVHGVRVVTPQGVSPLRLAVVDDLPSVPQQPNNTTRETAQEITLPVAVDGAVQNLSMNYYKFRADAGQRIAVEVLARRIGSPLDPMLRLFDAQGHEIAWSDDTPGLSADARFAYTVPTAGDYLLEIRDIRYQGSGNHIYRLRLGDFPCITTPFPMAVQRGMPTTVQFAGEDVADVPPLELTIPADSTDEWRTISVKRPGGQSSGMAVLAVSDAPEFSETEPNNEASQSNRVELGMNLNGRFDTAGDVDRFIFAAKKDQRYTLAAVTRRQGSPSDVYLRLYNAAGAKVAEGEDAGLLDAAITYTFPADGDYTLEVEDLHRRGGSPYVYRIITKPATVGFTLSASADHLNVPAGGTAMVTLTAARDGYSGPIELAAANLPAGVTSQPTVIGPGVNIAVLTVTAAPEAVGGTLVPIEIIGTGKNGDTELKATATITDALKTANAAMPWPPLGLAESVAAAVTPASGLRLRAEPMELVFGKDLSATVKIIAERGTEFDEAVALALIPPQASLPPGVTITPQPIPKGANEIAFAVAANAQAPLGEFTAVLVGTHAKNSVSTSSPVPGLRLKLQAPFDLAIDTAGGKLAKGGELKLTVTAQRNPAFTGPINVTLQNLPAGVVAQPATIPADQSTIEVMVTAPADAAAATVNNLVAKGDGMAGNAAVTADSPPATLTIE